MNITSPTEGSTVGEVILVEGTQSPISMTVYVNVNGVSHQMAQDFENWFAIVFIPDAPDGMITISVYGLGEGIQSPTTSVSVLLDRSFSPGNERPKIHLESPTEDFTEPTEFMFKGTTEDDSEMVTTYFTSWGYEWWILSTDRQWEREISVSWMLPGDYQIEIFAYDGERTSEVVTINFTVPQYILPAINILNPTSGQRFSQGLNISGDISGGVDPVREVWIRINGGEWILAEGGREWHYLLSNEGLELGEVEIEVKARIAREGSLDIVSITVFYKLEDPSTSKHSSWIFATLIILIVFLTVTVVLIHKRIHSRE